LNYQARMFEGPVYTDIRHLFCCFVIRGSKTMRYLFMLREQYLNCIHDEDKLITHESFRICLV